MSLVTDFLTSPLAERIGLTLLHSLWQLALIGALAYLLLECLRKASPHIRYLVAYSTLALMVLCPVMTFHLRTSTEPNHPKTIANSPNTLASESSFPSEAASLSLGETPDSTLISKNLSSQIEAPATAIALATESPTTKPAVSLKNPTTETSPSPPLQSTQTWQSWLNQLSARIAPWHPRLAVFWLVGFLFITFRNLGGCHATRRLRVHSNDPDDKRLQAMIATLSSRLGIKGTVQLRESNKVQTPILFGWLKPLILTPVGLLSQLSNEQLEALLAHELAHVRRHDYLFNILQTVAESLLFFHPAVWWLSRRIRLEREFCCDDLAVSLSSDHISYAQALASIEESRGLIGSGLSAGEKPLLLRIKRVLGLGPARSGRLSLLGISGGGLLLTLFCGLALLGHSQELNKDSENDENQEESQATELMQQNAAYTSLSKLTNEVKALVKAQQTEQAAEKTLTELLPISEAWLSDSFSSLTAAQVNSLQEEIAKDDKLRPLLITKIQALEEPPVTQAALFDMVGAAREAREIYGRLLSEDQDTPRTVRLHQIRLLGQKEPKELLTLLSRAPDSQQTENALAAALQGSQTFEESIQIFNAISSYLEEVELPTESQFRWVPRMEGVFNRRVYGDHQMPPLWEPQAGHSNSIKGKPSTPTMHETRLQAYQRFCQAALRHPSQAAWGFSSLGALADMQGNFNNSKELRDFAKLALQTSQEVTPLGVFTRSLEGPRFYSPELYLARSQWKGQPATTDLTPEVTTRITHLEKLFASTPDEFKKDAQTLINDSNLKETIYYYQPHHEAPAAVTARRSKEIMQISQERNQPQEGFDLLLHLVTDADKISAHSLSLTGEVFLDALNSIAKKESSAHIDEILEQIAIAYLGPIEERDQLISNLPDKNIRISWAGIPPVVQYDNFLRSMIGKSALTFPALKKAEELGILDRMSLYRWLPTQWFLNSPEKVIEYLDYSPMLAEVTLFRCYPLETGLQFQNTYPPSPTLLDRLIAELNKLDEKSKKPFLDYLIQKKSFGSKIILAIFEDDDGQSLVQVMSNHLDEITALPKPRKKELAAFIYPKLPKNESKIRNALTASLRDLNSERLQKFKEAFLEKPSEMRFGSSASSLFSHLYQDDPDKAIAALRLTIDLLPEALALCESQAQKETLLNPSFSASSELLKSLQFLKTTAPNTGKELTEFYLRVLSDKSIQSSLIVNQRLLNPRFSSGETKQAEIDRFKNALKWIAEIYPKNLPEEYLFIAAINRSQHVSSRSQQDTRTSQFFAEILATLPPEKRAIIEAGLILGSHSSDWVYRSHSTPKWTDPKIAAAFEEIGTRIRNKDLPMNLRLALASIVCERCMRHTPPALVTDCAELLADAWAQDAFVSRKQEQEILQVFTYAKTGEQGERITQQLLASWQKRNTRIEEALGNELNSLDRTQYWLIGLAATLDDDKFHSFLAGNWEKLDEDSARILLPLLVRAGRTDKATALFSRSFGWLTNHNRADRFFTFDAQLASHLPRFLEKIESTEERLLAEIFFNGFQNSPFHSNLPTRRERFVTLAQRASETEFENSAFRRTVHRLLSEERATAPFQTRPQDQ